MDSNAFIESVFGLFPKWGRWVKVDPEIVSIRVNGETGFVCKQALVRIGSDTL